MEEILALIFEMISSCISLVWSVLPFVGMWLVFEKAGEKGWKAIIPFYNMYTMFKIGDKQKHWKLHLIGVILYIVCLAILTIYMMWFLFAFIAAWGAVDIGWNALKSALPIMGIVTLVLFAGYVMMLITMIMGYSGICKKMNQGAGMVVGLIFLGPIFWMILGAGKEYQWTQSVTPEYQAPTYDPAEYHEPEWREPFAQSEGASKEI